MRTKIGIVLLIVVALVFARFFYVKFHEAQSAKGKAAAMIPVVSVDTVKSEDVANSVEISGRIAAKYSVDVVSKVQGTLLKKYFNEGDFVKQGQVLFQVDPAPYQIAANKASAALQNANAVAYRAQKDFDRAKELVAKDYIAKSTYDSNLAEKNVAYANIRSARAELADARRLLGYTKVTAPVSGRIGMVNVTEGNYITAQTGPLTRIVSVDPIYVTYSLDSKQFNQLRNDTIMPTVKQEEPIKVQITLPDGSVYKYYGNEDFYGNEISQSTGSISLRATFMNPDGVLVPGDFVKVKVFSNTKVKRLVVPQAAVLQDSTGRYVYTVDENGNAVQKYIKTDGEYKDYFIVSDGLEENDIFISDGVLKVRAGGKVKVVPKSSIAEALPENGTDTAKAEGAPETAGAIDKTTADDVSSAKENN